MDPSIPNRRLFYFLRKVEKGAEASEGNKGGGRTQAAGTACAAPALHGPVLFTRSGCPNCKTSKLMLDKAGVRYSVIDAEQDAESTRRYGVKKAPSLLVPDGDGFHMYDNASEIRRYIESIG